MFYTYNSAKCGCVVSYVWLNQYWTLATSLYRPQQSGYTQQTTYSTYSVGRGIDGNVSHPVAYYCGSNQQLTACHALLQYVSRERAWRQSITPCSILLRQQPQLTAFVQYTSLFFSIWNVRYSTSRVIGPRLAPPGTRSCSLKHGDYLRLYYFEKCPAAIPTTVRTLIMLYYWQLCCAPPLKRAINTSTIFLK